MAIEFRCTKCNKLLRTGDATAGKHAKCPECGEILVIPAGGGTTPPASAAGGFLPPPPSGPADGSKSPFGSSAGGNPFNAGPLPSYQPDSGNPYQSPSPFAPLPRAGLEVGGAQIQFGDIFSRTWAVYKKQWWAYLLGMFILLICYGVGSFGILMAASAFGFIGRNPIVMIFSVLVGYLLIFLFVSFLMGGGIRYSLNLARGHSLPLGDLFSGGPTLVPIFLSVLLMALITFALYLVFIVPGIVTVRMSPQLGGLVMVVGVLAHYIVSIYIWIILSQWNFLIVDRNTGVIESLRLSAALMRGNKLTYFLLLVLGLILMVPTALLVIGIVSMTAMGQPSILPLVALILVGAAWYLFGISLFVTMASVIYLKITGQPLAGDSPFGEQRY